MSRATGTPRADHQHTADMAREMPGQWVFAGTYNSSGSANGVAGMVRRADQLRFYRPAGAFEADVRLTDDGADLWVRYVDPEALAARDYRESIAAGLTEDFGAFSRRLDAAVTSKDT